MNSKVFIPFKDDRGIGGPSTFMTNLRNYLDSINFPYSLDYFNTRGIFFPIEYNFDLLEKFRLSQAAIIQRLDGIYYPSKHGENADKLNENIKKIYQQYASHIVFQSEYSKRQCFTIFGEKDDTEFSIIRNGVNKQIFFPGEKVTDKKWDFITTGNFRNVDMIEPIVLALDMLRSSIDFKLIVVGPVTDNKLNHFFNRPYVEMKGSKNLLEISDLLRHSDVFLYSHLNPPCPNSVLEAISCALPVVGFKSGAMSELCFFSQELLADVSDDIFQAYEDFSSESLLQKIQICINNYDYFKDLASQHSHLYSFEECGKKYTEVFFGLTKEAGILRTSKMEEISKKVKKIMSRILNLR